MPFQIFVSPSEEEKVNLNLKWLREFKVVIRNEAGDSTPTLSRFKQESKGVYANIGELSIDEARSIYKKYLNEIDNWTYELVINGVTSTDAKEQLFGGDK